MTITPARMVMALATRSLGPHRREWARAMTAEYALAEEDGRPLRFALGCLLGAWRLMPAHAEGRFVLTSHALAIVLLIPMATIWALAALFGFPFVAASDGLAGYVSGSGSHVLLLNDGSVTIAPSMTLLMLLMAACHPPLAWWVLERDWERVAAARCFGAALATTLTIVTACAALDVSRLALPVALLAAELGAISALARWHDRLAEERGAEETAPAN